MTPTTPIEHVLRGPIMEVYAINNGYLLVTRSPHDYEQGNVIYAKDEVAIAEEIIAAQARHKLDIEPKQGEMFAQKEMDRRKKK